MRVLVATTPGKGHIHPVVPLAAALVEAGHQLTWATGPESQDHVRSFGFDAVPAGMPVAERRAEVQRRNPKLNELPPTQRRRTLFPQTFAAVAGMRMLDDLAPVVDRLAPDVIVHEAAELVSPALAAARSVPNVCVGFGGAVAEEMLADDAVRALWDRTGMPLTESAGLYAHLYLHPMPPALQPLPARPTAAPIRPVGADGGEGNDAPEWVRDLGRDRPVVYSTFGTEFAMLAPLTDIRDALGEVDADVVLTTGATVDPSSLAPLPPNVRAVSYVPQRFVLDRAAAVLSQAGSGITLAACARGLPQVCLPLTADQFENAEMVRAAGVGVALDARELTVDEIAIAVREILGSEGMRAAAAQVATEISAMPAPGEHVPRIEALCGRA